MTRSEITLFICLVMLGLPLAGQCAPPLVRGVSPVYSERVTELARGVLLVAPEEMTDPRFRETVILLLEHGEQGSLGIIINRRTDTRLGTLVPEFAAIDPVQRPVYLGGPIAGSGLVFLSRSNHYAEQGMPVVDGVRVGDRAEVLEARLEAAVDDRDLRVYVGYCGWRPGQLVGEMDRGDWYLAEGNADRIFASPPESLWEKLIEFVLPRGLMVKVQGLSAPSS